MINMKEAPIKMITSLKMKRIKWKTQTSKVTTKMKMKVEQIKTLRNNNLQAKSVLINFVIPKRFIKSYVPRLNMQSTDSSAVNVMKVTIITIFVNFANKYIQVLQTQMMTINGLDVTPVVDGYLFSLKQNHIECEKKFRNKDINEVKDEDTQYLCLTCSYKPK